MRLYYSVSDPYPAYRVDISELFGIEMAALGVQVEWFMMGEPPQGHATGPLLYGAGQSVNLPPPVPAAGLWRRLVSWWADAAGVLRAAWRSDVDAVQCRDKFFVSLVAALACRLSGKPFFYWCSYPFPEHHVQAGRQQAGLRGMLQRFKGWLEFGLLYRLIMPLARHVFVQSEQMRGDIAGYGLPADRMTPVPMGVPVRLLQWAAQQRTEVVAGRVVYIGTLGAVRRLDMLVRAFALVHARQPQATLLIVGDGDFPHERQALEALVHSLGLDDSVRFTGFVPIEQAWSFAASAAVCVSPFFPTQVLRSASPTKLVEYLALGRPVVCNDHPEQSAILAACGAGHCVPWDEQAFADAMVALLQEPAQAESAASAGPGWVAAHRTYPQIARTVFDRYQALVPQRP